jgi:pimeloyl-ACP methyl ester carboxylesterase
MLSDRLRILYLHGFASSPASRKARFFSEKLRERDVQLEVPDLAAGDFPHLTISRQLQALEQRLPDESAVLIGSSLGGYLAALYASRHPGIEGLILLAPAFDFYSLWRRELGSERMASWEQKGWMRVFHYAEGREVPLSFEFMQDACRFDPYPAFAQPALVFHGTQDGVVPIESSVRFTEKHPNARLIRLDSGHELTDVLDTIWRHLELFLKENVGRFRVLD